MPNALCAANLIKLRMKRKNTLGGLEAQGTLSLRAGNSEARSLLNANSDHEKASLVP